MAIVQIRSANPQLSFLIKKNPGSGMMLRAVRKGTAYGWYSDNETYNVYFKDADNEISYKQNADEHFEYLNVSRYNSPLFALNAINGFFSAPLKTRDERDTEGYQHSFYGKLLEGYEASGFEKDQHHTAKGELLEKYGSHVYQNYKDLHAIRQTYVPLAEHEAAYETYKRQLELYAKEEELEYKPFAVLKLVKEDGTEQLPRWNTSEMFRFLSEDKALVLDLCDEDAVGKAEEFFAKLTTEEGMEGVVIKPELWDGKTVPYMKVRNADYLSIIYGYDYRFPHKYRKLMKQKSIREKLRTSRNEYQLGLRMLEIPFGSISPQHEEYKEIAASLLFEVAQEQGIDPRL